MTTRVRGKAHEALNEALEWIEASKEEVREREAALALAQQQLHMHETIYAVLEKTLTRQPRQKSTTKSSKKSAAKTSSKKRAGLPQQGLCVATLDSSATCRLDAKDAIHDADMGYSDYHPFTALTKTPQSAADDALSTAAGGKQ